MRRLAAVSLVAATAAAAAFLLDGEPAKPKAERVPTARQVVGFINHQRAVRSLPSLGRSSRLARAARRWGATLARTGDFKHAPLPSGWRWVAETLYRGSGGPVRAWLRSPPHRAIILSKRAGLIGIGRTGDVWVGRLAAR